MELKGESISLSQIAAVAHNGEAVRISALAQPRILASRKVVEEIIARDSVVYGVTTGFGKLSDVRIPRDALNELQLNLVRSHACGIGAPLSEPEVRAMMLLRANVLTLGFSGIRLEIIQMLGEMLNSRVVSEHLNDLEPDAAKCKRRARLRAASSREPVGSDNGAPIPHA